MKVKELMMKGMSAIMLDCDKATLYATKNDIERLNCMKRLQLKMHLASCKLCRNFVEQSKIIAAEVNKMKEIDKDHLAVHLTENQKSHLQETVDSSIESN